MTNVVAAFPEFFDENCGIVASAEDAEKMPQGITTSHEHPERFAEMSKAAAKRVRAQSDARRVICVELVIVSQNA